MVSRVELQRVHYLEITLREPLDLDRRSPHERISERLPSTCRREAASTATVVHTPHWFIPGVATNEIQAYIRRGRQ